MFDCLTDIVGISETECPCIVSGLTPEEIAALKVSKSQLFTDALPGGISLKALKASDACKSLATIAIEARDEAIRQTQDDMLIGLSDKHGKGKGAYKGNIGSPTFSATMQLSSRYAGLRLTPQQISDGILRLKGGQIVVSGAELLTIHVLRAYAGAYEAEEVGSKEVMTAANGWVTFTFETPLELPLSNNGRSYQYYVVYDRTIGGGVLPKNNKKGCNCGAAEKLLKEYLNVQGIALSSLTDMEGQVTSDYAGGLMLDVEIRCDSEKFVCREYDENNAVSLTLAYAVWYKAGELIIEKVLKSPEVNRMTLMNREYLWGKRSHFVKEYQARMLYLQGKIDIESTDCYICKDSEIFYSGIKS